MDVFVFNLRGAAHGCLWRKTRFYSPFFSSLVRYCTSKVVILGFLRVGVLSSLYPFFLEPTRCKLHSCFLF